MQGPTWYACSCKRSVRSLHRRNGCVTGQVQVSKPAAPQAHFGRSGQSTVAWHVQGGCARWCSGFSLSLQPLQDVQALSYKVWDTLYAVRLHMTL